MLNTQVVKIALPFIEKSLDMFKVCKNVYKTWIITLNLYTHIAWKEVTGWYTGSVVTGSEVFTIASIVMFKLVLLCFVNI